MDDDEFKEFLEKNKDRVIEFMKEEGPEFFDLAKTELKKGARKAKGKKDELKEKIQNDEKFEKTLKEFKDAVFDKEVQTHFLKMGMEFFLWMNALVRAMPKPDFVEETITKVSDNISEEFCKNNPNCSKKKKKIKKIELE